MELRVASDNQQETEALSLVKYEFYNLLMLF